MFFITCLIFQRFYHVLEVIDLIFDPFLSAANVYDLWIFDSIIVLFNVFIFKSLVIVFVLLKHVIYKIFIIDIANSIYKPPSMLILPYCCWCNGYMPGLLDPEPVPNLAHNGLKQCRKQGLKVSYERPSETNAVKKTNLYYQGARSI